LGDVLLSIDTIPVEKIPSIALIPPQTL
jgi:hypothetical protein